MPSVVHKDTAGAFSAIIETLKTLAALAANRLLHSDLEGLRFKTKEDVDEDKERKAEGAAEERKAQKEEESKHAQNDGEKKGGFLHSLVRHGVHAFHKALSGSPKSRRVMSADFSFTVKDKEGKAGKKHDLKKGDKFTLKPDKKKRGFFLFEQYKPFNMFTVDRSVMTLLHGKSEPYEKESAKPDEKDEESNKPPEDLQQEKSETTPEKPEQHHPEHNDMVSTLTGLGFKKNNANQAVHDATQKLGEKSEAKDVIKESLKNLRVKGSGDQAALAKGQWPKKIRVPVNKSKVSLAANLDILHFNPQVNDLLDVRSDRQFEQGPCTFTVYAASHGYCTVLVDDELFTFATDPVEVSDIRTRGISKTWVLV
jgi:hypothetical protein